MKRRAGFTLVEVLITITVMVILLTLTVVNLSGNQANARDEERKDDIAAIAQQLERYYASGQDSSTVTGEYPPTINMNSETNIQTALRDVNPKVLRDPLTPTTSSVSLIVASSASTPTLASLNGGKTYIYQPLDSSNALCTTAAQECRKFNLYYTLETDATIKTQTSNHQ
jgi:prepilin-type N-terminal cleavage/methylation domain-containing protein